MQTANESRLKTQPRQVVVSRTFPAPRELVFRAWSSADHIKNWFCPACFTVPEAEVEFHVGGKFNVCMRGPDGQDHWTKGHFIEIVPHTRLVLDLNVVDERDQPLFLAHTVVSFAEEEGSGTRMDVTQSYTLLGTADESMLDGAPIGWNQTLDRLEKEVARMQQSPTATSSTPTASH